MLVEMREGEAEWVGTVLPVHSRYSADRRRSLLALARVRVASSVLVMIQRQMAAPRPVGGSERSKPRSANRKPSDLTQRAALINFLPTIPWVGSFHPHSPTLAHVRISYFFFGRRH